ncbi:hypothetical protein GA0070608_6446 [Micromonospora peucetia]|uniref:SMI1 / KNR4 family (SUKH-1) n=1 Tax=Micromonospora peucetia TaxID=47871 RepID=A0A1C6W6H3_9ACTN|nr:hypothetical protein GA0070608_0101 [Micromonospora peucetia]SCL74123.1 hypothetical protein GA0070608_6446 [Micromonospora peucetia]
MARHDRAITINAGSRPIDASDTIILWRPTGQAELDLVAASGWRAWPPRLPDQPIFYPVLNRWYATKIAREWNVPAGGVGYVTRFEVQRAYLDRYEVHQVGGRDVLEYWIPAEELADLNAHIVGAIIEEADYRGPVGDQEFTDAHHALGRALPAAWRAYLQGASWFRRGWMTGGAYVWLNTPREMLELHHAWDESTDAHPGIAIIGGDGSREQLVLDLRSDPAPVLLVDITSSGWDNAIRQADDVGELIDRIEAGTFAFDFED